MFARSCQPGKHEAIGFRSSLNLRSRVILAVYENYGNTHFPD